jgi:hypothetical protein
LKNMAASLNSFQQVKISSCLANTALRSLELYVITLDKTVADLRRWDTWAWPNT